jgi:hypothetical protein
MRRPLLSTSLLSLSLLIVGASAAAAASLTRIETRPFYGATITIEEGVRVFRPLPPHRQIIINPDGKTPLNLTFEERNVTVNQYQTITEPEADDVRFGYGGGFYPGYPLKDRRFRHHRRHHGGGHLIHVPRSGLGGGGGGRGTR